MQHFAIARNVLTITSVAALLFACGVTDPAVEDDNDADADVVDPCVEAACVTLPFTGQTVTLDRADVAYRVTLSEPGFLAADVVADTTVTVQLRSSRNDEACLDCGGLRAGALLDPGDYYVVVAGPLGATYELQLGLTSAGDLIGHGMQQVVADDALAVFAAAWKRGDTSRFEYQITDFSQHSSARRQWIVDLATEALLFKLHVAHGRGSNPAFENTGYVPAFSNVPQSHLSSFGVMRSGEAYTGTYGSSFRIDGLEPALNDNVRDRAIVMHPWEGSRPEFIAQYGETQPTWGCPAIDDRIAPMVADRLHDGVLLFFWHPDWQTASTYLTTE